MSGALRLQPVAGRSVAGGLPEPAAAATGHVRKHIRGSSLLLAGRFLSVVLNFCVQVAAVRYLAKSDYGAFAYGLGVVTICATLVLAGLAKALPRMVAISWEKKDYPRTFGMISAAVTAVTVLGWSVVALVVGLRGVLAERYITDPNVLSVLVVLIALAPVNALDTLLQQLVAVFASPRAIFLRRHVLGPGLRLAAVLAVIFIGGSVRLLAALYVIAGAVGVALYVAVLVRQWHRAGVLHHLTPRPLMWPVRDLFAFSSPLLACEVANVARVSLGVILLEYFRATGEVGEYRAAMVVANLNELVFEAFSFLYLPLASRMFARDERREIGNLYWQTAQWITVLTFPIFALTCVLSGPLTVLLYGEQYTNAAVLMSVLAVGYYVHVALGFNAATLLAHGELRLVVLAEALSMITAVTLSFLLIPPWGGMGAAVSMMSAMVVLNLVCNLSLWLGEPKIRPLDAQFIRVYGLAIALALALLVAQRLASPPLWLGIACAAAASMLLIRITRQNLRLEHTFPELLRIPLLRTILR